MTGHDLAMDLCARADTLARAGDIVGARALYAEALPLARDAAEAEQSQPSRAILHRSAAWCAFYAGNPREALRLASAGLSADGLPERYVRELVEVQTYAALFNLGAS